MDDPTMYLIISDNLINHTVARVTSNLSCTMKT